MAGSYRVGPGETKATHAIPASAVGMARQQPPFRNPPMKRVSVAILLLVASSAFGANFSAADVPGIRLRQAGKIVIRNDGDTITAYRFSCTIPQALLPLRTVHALRTVSYGSVLFDANVRVR